MRTHLGRMAAGSGGRRSGFSLTELLIVLAVIAILVGLGLTEYANSARNARRERAKQDLDTIANAIRSFNKIEKRPFFKSRNLRALQGKYLEKLPNDPWGEPYQVDGTFVFSKGPNRKTGVVANVNYMGDDVKWRYERDSIVSNPEFNVSRDRSGVSRPTSWKFNPALDKESLDERKEVKDEPGEQVGNMVMVTDKSAFGPPNAIFLKP